MLAVLPFVIGAQLLLSAVGYDIANRPTNPLARDMATLLRFLTQCSTKAAFRRAICNRLIQLGTVWRTRSR